jgi:secreted protein with Ig-like and vWFA domain
VPPVLAGNPLFSDIQKCISEDAGARAKKAKQLNDQNEVQLEQGAEEVQGEEIAEEGLD